MTIMSFVVSCDNSTEDVLSMVITFKTLIDLKTEILPTIDLGDIYEYYEIVLYTV